MTGWLSVVYWSPGIDKDEVVHGARNSTLVVGCYDAREQVGFLRVVSDKTRFGYFLDVYVDEVYRRKGIALGMMRFALEHPELKDVYFWLLGTKEAHGLYEKLGFAPLPEPQLWMMKNTPWGKRPRAIVR